MKKITAVTLTVFMLITMLAGCSGSKEAASDAVSGDGTLQSQIDTSDEYIAVCCLNNLEYFNAHKYGWEKAGELFGVKTSWVLSLIHICPEEGR